MTPKMTADLEMMIEASIAFGESWQKAGEAHHNVHDYPTYLPSFDQFIHDLIDFRDANTS